MKCFFSKYLVCLFVLLISCQSKKQNVQITESIPTEIVEEVFNEIDSENAVEIIESSLNDLSLVSNEWVLNSFYCAESETFLFVKRIEDKGIIAVGVGEIQKQRIFFLYIFDRKGAVLSKEVLTAADYSINNPYNFQFKNNRLHYTTNTRAHSEMAYDFKSKKHYIIDEKQLDWSKIKDWRQHSIFPSPDGNLAISFSDVNLILTNHQTNKVDTLISQKYDGSWSFGMGVWTEDNYKFYFDNSGGVACIWEIDFTKNTLDKIVPEHDASSPIIFSKNENKILYCEMNCIKLAEQKKVGINK